MPNQHKRGQPRQNGQALREACPFWRFGELMETGVHQQFGNRLQGHLGFVLCFHIRRALPFGEIHPPGPADLPNHPAGCEPEAPMPIGWQA